MSFRAENCAYEKWLKTQCDVVEDDLIYKHKRMHYERPSFGGHSGSKMNVLIWPRHLPSCRWAMFTSRISGHGETAKDDWCGE